MKQTDDNHQACVLELRDIHKSYGTGKKKKEVLRGISLDLEAGQVLALLGANGSGKTTLVRILTTLSQADAGQAFIAGYDIKTEADQVRKAIGLTGQFAAVDEELTARENLIFFGGLQGLNKKTAEQRAYDLLELFGLDSVGDQLVRAYSGGMKRRLDIAISMVVTPQLLFLDEPTTGLDPVSRRELWEMIKELKDAGVSIFLTTQYLEEAEALADQIYILREGQIVLQGSPTYITDHYGSALCQLSFHQADDLEEGRRLLLASDLGLEDQHIIQTKLDLSFKASQGVEDLSQAIQLLDQAGISLRLAALQPPSLESIFIDIAYGQAPIERRI